MADTTSPRRLADRIQIVQRKLAVDLKTTGAVLRAVDSTGNVEAGARALEPLYDHLGGWARAAICDRVAVAMTAAGPRA